MEVTKDLHTHSMPAAPIGVHDLRYLGAWSEGPVPS